MTPVAKSVGVSRLYQSQSIKYPLGFPGLGLEEERAERTAALKSAVEKLKSGA